MIPELLDAIGVFAGSYFLLAVDRKPSHRQLLRDGGISAVLIQVLKTGGDIRMLHHIREIYPDPDVPIVKATLTIDPFLVRRVCIMWNSWFSNYAYIISCGRPFRWGADNIQADEYTKRQYRIVDPSEYILAAPSDFDERDTDDGSDEEASDEEEFNPYFRATLAERLAVITSGQVTDVNYIVCDLVQGFGGCMEELRKFIEINGVEHMKKIRGRLYIRGPVEHAMWLINLCVDLGYKGVRCTQALGPISRIERGIIYYNYPSNDDPDVACFIYFNKGFKKLTGRYKRDIHSCCCSG